MSLMVLNIELDYDISVDTSLQVLQRLIQIIQHQVYRMKGSFHKVISYEGGFTVVCSWGMPPYTHVDQAARACIAANNIQKKVH